MRRLRNYLLMILGLVAAERVAEARVWTDSTGRYTVDAELIAYDNERVVLQRADHELAAVPLDKLSDADRDYLESKEASDIAQQVTGGFQTWTMRGGLKVIGKVVDYARKDVSVDRRRGKLYVNDRLFDNLPAVYRRIVPKVVGHFEGLEIEDEAGLRAWAARQTGRPKTFTCDGVVLELENGDEYVVPFFFFSQEDLKVLEPSWDRWLAARDDYERRDDEAFMLRSLAAARYRDRQVERQIATMQLNLQAVQTGVTSLWEVTLYPAAGNTGSPLWVVMPGRNSAQATASALQQNPGYVAGPVRRVSR